MTKQMIACLCSLLVLSISCKKDNATDNTNPSGPVLLKKLIALDPTMTAPNDTVIVITYSYDNLNRCTFINNVYYPDLESFQTYNYYNGNDTLMASRTLINFNPGDTSKEIFAYSAAGDMIFDSTVNISNGIAHSLVYKYEITNTVIHGTVNINNDPFLKVNYYIQKDQNGNVIAESDSSFKYTAGSGFLFWIKGSNTITYDNKPCPIYKLYPKRLVNHEYENSLRDDDLYTGVNPKNNILTVTTNNSTLPTLNETFNYTYQSNGYPTTVTFNNNVGTTYKVLYVY